MRSFILLLLVLFTSSSSAGGISIGQTRVVFPSSNKSVSFSMENTGESLYLLQSWLEDEQNQKTNALMVTPPLIKLAAKQKNNLNILNVATDALPADKETLFWLNVKAIPAIKKSLKNKNKIVLAIKTRVKVFYRPDNLEPSRDVAAEQLEWRVDKQGYLTLSNPTPYYLTLPKIDQAADTFPGIMLAPKQTLTLDIRASDKPATFVSIDDFGAQQQHKISLD